MKQSGLTFIELIISLLIMTLLGLYAWPNYRDLKLNQDMTHAINRLSATLQFARSQSILNNQQVVVCPSRSSNQCDNGSQWHLGWMVFNDDNRDRELSPNETILMVEQAFSSQLLARSSAGRPRVRYDATGFASGTNLSIRFCDERGAEHAKALIVNNAGRVRIDHQNNRCQ